MRVGLTGGIGSGKSTVARLLVQLGACLLDADALVHTLTAAGGAAMPAILAAFGPDFVDAAGALDRARMRTLIHSDNAAKSRLEGILHPQVAQQMQALAQAAQQQCARCIVFDIPLLAESAHWRPQLDHVLVVDCTPSVQTERVMARNQFTQEQVQRIMASQASRAQRLQCADSVICNAHLTMAELEHKVHHIAHRFGLSSGAHSEPCDVSA